MGTSTKIILGIVISLLCVFLLFVTFFQKPVEVFQDIYDTISMDEGVSQIEKQDDVFITTALQDTITGIGFFVERVTSLDSIFSQNIESYVIGEERDTRTISLELGSFAFDIRDFSQQYNISGEGFQIFTLGQGLLFIENQEDSVTIFSQSSTLKIDLLDGSQEKMTEVYMYPHMFLSFTPQRNQFLENGDIVRVSSITDLGYTPESFQEKDVFDLLSVEVFGEFFSDVFLYQSQKNIQARRAIERMKNTYVFDFPGSEHMERYYQFFINDEKKKAYYKNKFLKHIISFVQDPSPSQDTSALKEVLASLSVYEQETQETQDIKEFLSYIFSYSYDDADIDKRKSLANNFQNNRDTESLFSSSLYLAGLYNQYDFEKQYSYQDLQSFFDNHLIDIGVDIQQQNSFSTEKKIHLDYFVFFLEKIFIGGLGLDQASTKKTLQYDDIIGVFSDYSQLSTVLYSLGDTKKKITALYIYVDILGNFEKYIYTTFFEDERGKNQVLIRKQNTSISGESFISLRNQVNTILDFYSKNKFLLDVNTKRDFLIDKSLSTLKSNFNEYFLALENYESYVFNYDETKKNLLSLQTGESTDLVFNPLIVKNYLSQFVGSDTSSMIVKISENPIQASVENYYLNGKSFSFTLYPLSEYLIDSIVIDGKRIASSYKLNLIEADWEEKNENITQPQDKTKYDFTYFFNNTFFSQTETTAEIFEINESVEEDKVIVVFKRDKLLGSNGEFASLNDFLILNYNDIQVTPNGDIYDIYLQNVPAKISVNSSSGILRYVFNISGEYILNSSTRSFKDLQVKKYRDFEKDATEFSLDGASITLDGQIGIRDLESSLQAYAVSYSEVSNFLETLTQNIPFGQLTGTYFPTRTSFRISGVVNTKSVSMIIEGNQLTSLKINNEEKLDSPIETTNINKISLLLFSK